MKCGQCGKEMNVLSLEMSENESKCRQEFGCTNPKCGAYTGNNLNNPIRSCKGEWITI